MSGRNERVRGKLRSALDEQRLVRIERRPRFGDRVDGFVVGVGRKWALVASTMDGGFADGFSAIRVRDVRHVRRDRSFEGTFARTQDNWPPASPGAIDLDSTAGMLRTLAATARIIAIEKEHERWATWIGELVEVEGGWVALYEIRPDATWVKRPHWYELRALTQASVGTHYLVALDAVAERRRTTRSRSATAAVSARGETSSTPSTSAS